jgi:Na+-driven multidrug efflux pump
MEQQIASPLARGYGTAANILAGQSLGRGEPGRAYFDGWAAAALAVLTVGGLGIVLVAGAEWFALAFTRDPTTLGYAVDFARAYGVATFLIALYVVISGSLRGGSETLSPFLAKLSGAVVFLLGVSYVFGLRLEYGVVAAYVAIVADFAWRNVVVVAVYYRRNWLDRGAEMMHERGSVADED